MSYPGKLSLSVRHCGKSWHLVTRDCFAWTSIRFRVPNSNCASFRTATRRVDEPIGLELARLHFKAEAVMSAAYIEHRPLPSHAHEGTTHHSVAVDGREIQSFKTQKEAADWAIAQGHKPVHVALTAQLTGAVLPKNQYAHVHRGNARRT